MASSAIAEAFVTLRPDTKHFERDAQAQIGAPLSKIAKGAAAVFGTIGAAKVLGGAIGAARESNKIAAQTEAVIRSTGNAAHFSAKQMSDLANSIAAKTGVDDEQIQSGANLLRTFTGIRNEVGKGNDIFTQATKIAVDMSAALGQDMSSSAIQLGKALNDPIRGVTALQRVGVSFTESQKEQIKTLVETGRTMDAQKLVLRELTNEFGGSAEAQATASDKLRVTVGNLEESLGNILVPVLDKVAAGLNAGIHVFEGLPQPIQTATLALGTLAVASVPVLRAYDSLSNVVSRTGVTLRNSEGDLTLFGKTAKGLAFMGGTLAALEGLQLGAQAVGAGARSAAEDIRELSTATDKFLAEQFRAGLKENSGFNKLILALGPGSDVTDDIRNRFRRIAAESEQSAQQIIDALKKQGLDTSAYVKILDQEESKSKAVAKSQKAHADAISGNTDATQGNTDAVGKNNAALDDSATILEKATKLEEEHRKKIEDVITAMDDRREAALADADAEVALARADNNAQDAVNAYTAALKEHGAKSDDVRRSVLDYRDSLSQAATAAVNAAEQDRKAHGQAALTVQEKVGIQIAELGKLRDTLAPGSPLRQVVEDYINRLKAVPTDLLTRLRVQIDSNGVAVVRNDKGEITLKTFATGGRPPVDFPSLVGERGPELFIPDRAGTIIPNNELNRFLAGVGQTQSGGSAAPIQVQITAPSTDATSIQRAAVLGLRKLQYEGVL